MVSFWIALLGLLIAVRFFGLFSTIVGVVLYYSVQIFGLKPLLVTLGIILALLFVGLIEIRKSVSRAVVDVLAIGLVVIGWALSRFATFVRVLGGLVPFTTLLDRLFSLYPGEDFVEKHRDDFMKRGIDYINQGVVDVEQSSEDLAQEARAYYYKAGRQLSNGEAVLGIALAAFGILSLEPYWDVPPAWIGAVLSAALVLTVTLRLTALDALMYHDPTPDQEASQLLVIRDWNQAVASGTEVVKLLLMLRATWSISEPAYNFYLDWTFRESLERGGATSVKAARALWKPFRAFNEAQVRGISPSEASKKIYGEDVFASTELSDLGYSDSSEHSEEVRQETISSGD